MKTIKTNYNTYNFTLITSFKVGRVLHRRTRPNQPASFPEVTKGEASVYVRERGKRGLVGEYLQLLAFAYASVNADNANAFVFACRCAYQRVRAFEDASVNAFIQRRQWTRTLPCVK